MKQRFRHTLYRATAFLAAHPGALRLMLVLLAALAAVGAGAPASAEMMVFGD
jgi:hypothetical protein